jgi:glycosyltransferase involved in cell wall biosynthesis
MRLSIVINNYNYAQFIASAIRSAINVQWDDKEIIVVDDGSTDRSREVIASFGDSVIAIFKENGGQNSAANAGFARSSGDAILFLDSDDTVLPELGGEVAKLWRPHVAKVQFAHRYIDEWDEPTGAIWPRFSAAHTAASSLPMLRRRGYYLTPTTSGNVFARYFLQQVFPLSTCHRGAPGAYYGFFFDAYLNMMAPCFGDVVTLKNPMGCYRVHAANGNSVNKSVSLEFVCNRTIDDERIVAEANQMLAALGKSPGFIIDCERDEMYMRYRLVGQKLRPEKSSPNLAVLFGRYCCSVMLSEENAKHKVFNLVWATLVFVAPGPIAQWAFQVRSAPSLRPSFLRHLMRANCPQAGGRSQTHS